MSGFNTFHVIRRLERATKSGLATALSLLTVQLTVVAQETPADLVVRDKVAQMVAQTKADYHAKRFVLAPLSNVDPCSQSICSQQPLPVSLILFEAKRLAEGAVAVLWETSMENNSHFFVVERSAEGARSFQAIAKVDGAGNSAVNTQYRFLDHTQSQALSYYRLKQVDFDGSFTYSNIVTVAGISSEISLLAFPNPAENSQLQFQLKGAGSSSVVEVVVYGPTGTVFYREASRLITTEQSFQLPIASLPAGVYTIVIRYDQTRATTKFVISR